MTHEEVTKKKLCGFLFGFLDESLMSGIIKKNNKKKIKNINLHSIFLAINFKCS